MRSWLLIVALGGIVAPAIGQASGPASGEVLLQIVAEGEDRRPADEVTIIVQVNAFAATSAAARAAASAKVDRLISDLTALGIGRSAIVQVPSALAQLGFINNEADGDDPVSAGVRLPATSPRRSAGTAIRIKLVDLAQLARIQPALDAQDLTVLGLPSLTLRDEDAARRSAIARAVARARGDADTQAAALGLHIIRFVRAANYTPPRESSDYLTDIAHMMEPQRESGGNVVTRVKVSIDYIAVPAAK